MGMRSDWKENIRARSWFYVGPTCEFSLGQLDDNLAGRFLTKLPKGLISNHAIPAFGM